MSYGNPAPTPRRRGGCALFVALATFVLLCCAGWPAWRAMTGVGDARAQAPTPTGGGHAPNRPSSHTPGEPSPSRTPSTSPAGTTPPAKDRSPEARSHTGPLSGKVVVIDPGHNPRNRDHAHAIARPVNIGTNRKECDTTGTSTDDGYTEAAFTLDVAHRIRRLLEEQGATVKFTQDGDRPYGPCVDERARIGNEAGADAVVSVHADGSGAGNRGFHVILPAAVRAGKADTSSIVGPSRELGERIAGRFARETGSRPANYISGGLGLDVRSDLGGLNLSAVPKVFIECGNMRDPHDAALLKSGAWRERAARGIADGIQGFLKS